MLTDHAVRRRGSTINSSASVRPPSTQNSFQSMPCPCHTTDRLRTLNLVLCPIGLILALCPIGLILVLLPHRCRSDLYTYKTRSSAVYQRSINMNSRTAVRINILRSRPPRRTRSAYRPTSQPPIAEEKISCRGKEPSRCSLLFVTFFFAFVFSLQVIGERTRL